MWYCTIGDQERGPFSETELRALLDGKDIQPQTQVRRASDPEWAPLELTSLAEALGLRPAAKIRRGRCAFSGLLSPRADMCLVDGFWIAKDYRQEAELYVRSGGWLPTEVSGLRAKGFPGLGHVAFETLMLLRRAGPAACLANVAVNVPLLYFLNQAPAIHGNFDLPQVQAVLAAYAAGWITVAALGLTLVLHVFSRHFRGDHSGAGEWLATAKTHWGPVAGLLVLTLTACFATSVACHYATYPNGGSTPTGFGILFSVISVVALVLLILFSVFAPMIIVDRSMPPFAAVRQSRLISMEHLKTTLFYVVFSPLILGLVVGLLLASSQAVWPPEKRPELLIDTVMSVAFIPVYAFWFCYYRELEALYIAKQEAKG